MEPGSDETKCSCKKMLLEVNRAVIVNYFVLIVYNYVSVRGQTKFFVGQMWTNRGQTNAIRIL